MRKFRPNILESLEPRRMLTVAPQIQLLDDTNVITAGQAVYVSALQPVPGSGTDLGAGTPLTAKYDWNFGDTTPGSRFNALPGWTAAHAYDTPGIYTVTLTIRNENGETGTDQRRIRVTSPQVTPQVVYID